MLNLLCFCRRLKKRIDEPLVTEDIAKPSMVSAIMYTQVKIDVRARYFDRLVILTGPLF